MTLLKLTPRMVQHYNLFVIRVSVTVKNTMNISDDKPQTFDLKTKIALLFHVLFILDRTLR